MEMVYNGDIGNIDVEQIDHVDLLRDASSTSLYGIGAGNGVIAITTRGTALTAEPVETGKNIVREHGWILYRNAVVEDVFDQLATQYHWQVQYAEKELKIFYCGVLPQSISGNTMIKILNAAGVACTLEHDVVTVR